MSYTIGKTYVLANDTNYTPGIIGIADSVAIIRNPTTLAPGPHTAIATSSPNGKGLLVDITTIDGVVLTYVSLLSTSGYTPGTYTGLATTAVTGTGTGLTVNVVIGIDGLVSSVTINDGGQDYANNDNIAIDGTLLGGATPADDVTFKVDTLNSKFDTITINQPGKNYVDSLYATVLVGSNDGLIQIVSTIQGPLLSSDSHILGFHVLKTNTADVVVTHANGSVSSFGAGSLMQGAIYPYSVIKIVLDGGDVNTILGTAPGVKTVMF